MENLTKELFKLTVQALISQNHFNLSSSQVETAFNLKSSSIVFKPENLSVFIHNPYPYNEKVYKFENYFNSKLFSLLAENFKTDDLEELVKHVTLNRIARKLATIFYKEDGNRIFFFDLNNGFFFFKHYWSKSNLEYLLQVEDNVLLNHNFSKLCYSKTLNVFDKHNVFQVFKEKINSLIQEKDMLYCEAYQNVLSHFLNNLIKLGFDKALLKA